MVSSHTNRVSNVKSAAPRQQQGPGQPSPVTEQPPPEWLAELVHRLDTMEALLQELIQQRTMKDRYTTTEVARIVGKSEYTVREWCRKGQIEAEKAPNGRGWLISHQELTGIQNGELPRPEIKEEKSGS